MKRRVIGMLLAILLAAGGTIALVAYVQTAKNRAVASEELVDVYVVDTKIPKGAAAETIRGAVRVEQVPTRLRQPDAVSDLGSLTDKVALVELLPGEQLVTARLGEQAAATESPTDKVQVSVRLDPERAVGGLLKPGDSVGIFLSFDSWQLAEAGPKFYEILKAAAAPDPIGDKTPNLTHLEFQKVMVTGVQIVDTNAGSTIGNNKKTTESTDVVVPVSNQQLIVTVALTAPQAEQLVFTAEFGHVWLASEPATVSEDGTRIITLGDAYSVALG
jgi:pilus assembly protein CpaB